MSYIAQADLSNAVGDAVLIQLTDDTGAGVVGQGRLQTAINYACSTIDAYARTRYPIPLPITPLVTSLAVDLALFELYKGRASFADDGVYKIRKDGYEAAIKRLQDIHSGKAALDLPTAQEAPGNPGTADSALGASSTHPSIFDPHNLRSY